MARANVTLYVVPSTVNLRDLADYSVEEVGAIRSNLREVKVNKVDDGYSIIYDSETFKALNPRVLIFNIIGLFRKNLPATFLEISLEYLYELDDDDDDAFEMSVAEAVMAFDICFHEFLKTADPSILRSVAYVRADNLEDVKETYAIVRDGGYGDDDDDDEDMAVFYAPRNGRAMTELDRILGRVPDDDDDDDWDDRPRKKRWKGYDYAYGSSKVLRSAKNPKRAYKRHGVLIARNKSAVRKDRKILKEFLKEFIPGSAQWKKDLRNELVDRWISVYAVTTKQLKRLERKHRKMLEAERKPKINTEGVLNFARGMVTQSMDSWNDPNK